MATDPEKRADKIWKKIESKREMRKIVQSQEILTKSNIVAICLAIAITLIIFFLVFRGPKEKDAPAKKPVISSVKMIS